MKTKDLLLLIFLLCGGFVIALIIQNKKIQQLTNALMVVDNKADQSNLASRLALEQTNELIEGQEMNEQKMIEEWHDREPIGFRPCRDKNA